MTNDSLRALAVLSTIGESILTALLRKQELEEQQKIRTSNYELQRRQLDLTERQIQNNLLTTVLSNFVPVSGDAGQQLLAQGAGISGQYLNNLSQALGYSNMFQQDAVYVHPQSRTLLEYALGQQNLQVQKQAEENLDWYRRQQIELNRDQFNRELAFKQQALQSQEQQNRRNHERDMLALQLDAKTVHPYGDGYIVYNRLNSEWTDRSPSLSNPLKDMAKYQFWFPYNSSGSSRVPPLFGTSPSRQSFGGTYNYFHPLNNNSFNSWNR